MCWWALAVRMSSKWDWFRTGNECSISNSLGLLTTQTSPIIKHGWRCSAKGEVPFPGWKILCFRRERSKYQGVWRALLVSGGPAPVERTAESPLSFRKEAVGMAVFLSPWDSSPWLFLVSFSRCLYIHWKPSVQLFWFLQVRLLFGSLEPLTWLVKMICGEAVTYTELCGEALCWLSMCFWAGNDLYKSFLEQGLKNLLHSLKLMTVSSYQWTFAQERLLAWSTRLSLDATKHRAIHLSRQGGFHISPGNSMNYKQG